MKNLRIISLALLTLLITVFSSCSKDYDSLGYEDADVIHNQGLSKVIVNGLDLSVGQKEIVHHTLTYTIECFEECKVNINGSIYYESGVFKNELFRYK